MISKRPSVKDLPLFKQLLDDSVLSPQIGFFWLNRKWRQIWRECLFCCGGLFQIQDQAESRITTQVVAMQALTFEETKAFIEFQGWLVRDFGFKGNL